MEPTLEANAGAATPVRERRIEKILVPTDFSEGSSHAFRYALDLARSYGARVNLLHVIEPIEGDTWSPLRYSPEASVLHETPAQMISGHLAREIERHNTAGVVVESATKQGVSVVSAVVGYAQREGVDLIVMGTHGRHGLKRLLRGNVAEGIVQKALCDVLVVATKA